MKRFFIYLMLSAAGLQLPAQGPAFRDAQLRDLNGNLISVSAVVLQGQPLVMVFWKSGNSRCCENLETIQSAWMSNLKDKGVGFIAICEDCSGSWAHVKPYIMAKEWDFDIYIDVNGDLKRELGVTSIPSTLLFGKDMQLLCRHPGWCSGSEELLCEKIIGHLNSTEAMRPAQ